MQRAVLLTILPFFVWSCSASDRALGVNQLPPDPSALTRVDLGTLGGASSYATAINGTNVVVGWSETGAGTVHGFRWTAGTGMLDLGALPGHQSSQALAILDARNPADAEILGVSGDGTRWTPVIWSRSGSVKVLPVPSSPSPGFPTDINRRGDVVGWDAPGGFQHGWVWSATDGKYDLSANLQGGSSEGTASAITSSGLVLLTVRTSGCARTQECWRTFLWSKATGYQSLGVPGAATDANVTGLGVNEAGSVVGWTTIDAGSGIVPYRWTTGAGFSLLPQYGSGAQSYGYATAVNSAGTVVGAALDPASGSIVATAWPTSGGIVRLSAGDLNPSVAVAINSSGNIAGWAVVSSNANHAVVWKSEAGGAHSLSASMLVPERSVSTSARCLKSSRALSSRQALFDCVGKSQLAP
ncbi:MAG TPA: hypothetical protein VJ840_16815 [Gemmatimonadaceae bacterium]|nr:hypothetical protein [Gemmatimonadaceae bacterium]